jgi:heat-inducible transcriptional repressor
MLNERRRQVLSALIEEYVSSAHPVGSKALVERYELRCSPATVRNELAILEETGHVFQPHTSSGRVPTDSGYRAFVDALLSNESRASAQEDSAHGGPLAGAEIDDLMRETSALLSRLTNCMAVVLAPTLARAAIRRIDLLWTAPSRALFVLITQSAHVVNRHIELSEATTPERLAEVERALNASLDGKSASEIRQLREAMAQSAPDALVQRVVDAILECLDEADRDRLYHGGVLPLLSQPEFSDAGHVRPLLSALEDGLTILETLSGLLEEHGVAIRIGHENRRVELANVSIVATHYGDSSTEGVVGIIGPTRMDYSKAISAVRWAADGLNEALS